MSREINITVGSDTAAAQLRQDFDELIARVNGDMMFQSIQADDPVSVEATVANAERSIDVHLREFTENGALQSLAGEIKQQFRESIEAQARAAAQFAR
ncbi:MAG: hypothetical protein HOQ35_01030 [Acidobacteriaceae bacterium]|nr:hypothetical protein [Acidobacteriaceae bacterium]